MRNIKIITPAIAGMLLLSGAGHAAAQTAAQTAAKSGDAATSDVTVGEVVVTAQRRSERAIEVPQTVNLVTSVRLVQAGVTDSLSLSQVIPGLTMVPSGLAAGQPTIRGIGTSITTVGSSASVATYIDGVYQLAQSGDAFELNNIDKVEVLKGPQGTLYGRNSTGGVILITTKDPSFTPHGSMTVGYGNYNGVKANAYLTGGIANNLAGNLSVNYGSNDGYFYDIYRHDQVGAAYDYGIRGKLLYQLAGDGKIVLSLTHTYTSDPTAFDAAPLNGNTVARATPGTIIPTQPYQVALNFSPYIRNNYTQVSVVSDFGTDKVHFNNITSGNINQLDFLADTDFSPLPSSKTRELFDERQFSEELTASSVGNQRLTWIAGVSYVHQSGKVTFPSTTNIIGTTTNDSYSGFAELTLHVTDKLSVVGGARYTYEDLTYAGTSNGVAAADAATTASVWTPRVSVDYSFADHAKVYATYSQGYRSGGWNGTALSNTPYLPEYVTAYEVGAKVDPTSQLSLSAAAFYYDFKDIQFQAAQLVSGVYKTAILNAARATTYGAEANADWRVSPSLSIQAGMGYTHATYDSFPNAFVTVPKPTGGNTQIVEDVSGNTAIRTPAVTVNLGATYTASLAMGRLELSANGVYTSKVYFDPGNRLSQPGFAQVNARAAFTPDGKPVQVALWVKNIADVRYLSYVNDNTLGDRATWAPPRTFGVTVTGKF